MTHRHKIVLGLIVVVMFNLLLVILFGDNGLVELGRMRDSHQRLVQSNADLIQNNLQMYRSIDRLQHDWTFIEYVARQEMGMIRSDELIFKFSTDSKVP